MPKKKEKTDLTGIETASGHKGTEGVAGIPAIEPETQKVTALVKVVDQRIESPDDVEDEQEKALDINKLFEQLNELRAGFNDHSERLGKLDYKMNILENCAPKVSKLEAEPEEVSSIRTYTVVKGDTMAKIAKRLLGNSGRFNEISSINYVKYPSLKREPNVVEPGWVLIKPN